MVNTCFVGYVTAPDRMIVLLSTAPNDPLVNREVRVHLGSEHLPIGAIRNDLGEEVGSVVMLDATETDAIEDAHRCGRPALTARTGTGCAHA